MKEFIWLLCILTFSILSIQSFSDNQCRPTEFFCFHDETCILKNLWCDSGCDCSNCEDEDYCNIQPDYEYEDDIVIEAVCPEYGREMFKCGAICLPVESRCDGIISCPDGSDELDCECEKIEMSEGHIYYNASFENLLNKKCWKFGIPPDKYLELNILNLNLYTNASNLSIKWKEKDLEELNIIYNNQSYVFREINTYGETEIHFQGSANTNMESLQADGIHFKFKMVDRLCQNSGVFKCAPSICIPLEKMCDGVLDCPDGFDERNCKGNILSIEGVNNSRNLGLEWLKNQNNAAWGWRENTHRAVVAMYLADGANFNGSNKDEELTAKQLELQMSTAILRNGTDFITPTQLSMYINALLTICHDPRNFYGYNLVNVLKYEVEKGSLFHPSSCLALCNAKEILSEKCIERLFAILYSYSEHSFVTDLQAVTITALSCILENSSLFHLKKNLTDTVRELMIHQREDGSFGNTYTTALIMQGIISSGNVNFTDWNMTKTIEFLKKEQNEIDGSFGDFLATYLILPILNGKSLADIAKVNCSETLIMKRNGGSISDLNFKLGLRFPIQYSLYIGDDKRQEHPIILSVPNNTTVLEMMTLAAAIDPKYRFKYQEKLNKKYIYEVSGLRNDPEDGKFWLLFKGKNKESLSIQSQSPDEILINENDIIVMWYKFYGII